MRTYTKPRLTKHAQLKSVTFSRENNTPYVHKWHTKIHTAKTQEERDELYRLD